MHHFSDKLTNNRFRRHQLETTTACKRTVKVQIRSYLQLIPAWEGKKWSNTGYINYTPRQSDT